MSGEFEKRFRHANTEAANRAEVTALLIRSGYRVYRPEADLDGEDLVVRTPPEDQNAPEALLAVQLKGRALVDWRRYGGRDLWMLFPSTPFNCSTTRDWYLVPHDSLFRWMEKKHGTAPRWDATQEWHYPKFTKELTLFLGPFLLAPPGKGREDRFQQTVEGVTVIKKDGSTLALAGLSDFEKKSN